MTILNIILIIYISGLFFNFGIVFDDNMNNDNTIKDNFKFIASSFLSWMLWPILYIYQAIVKKTRKKKSWHLINHYNNKEMEKIWIK